MLDNLTPIKRLTLITSITVDLITAGLVFIVLFLPLNTTNKTLRLWGLGTGIVACKISFYLLKELNKMETFLNGKLFVL